MGKLIFLSCLAFCLMSAAGAFAGDAETSDMLHPIVAQMPGRANTVIMWHDINDDGLADYRAIYVFKAGKLHQLSKEFVTPENSGNLKPRKMGVFNG